MKLTNASTVLLAIGALAPIGPGNLKAMYDLKAATNERQSLWATTIRSASASNLCRRRRPAWRQPGQQHDVLFGAKHTSLIRCSLASFDTSRLGRLFWFFADLRDAEGGRTAVTATLVVPSIKTAGGRPWPRSILLPGWGAGQVTTWSRTGGSAEEASPGVCFDCKLCQAGYASAATAASRLGRFTISKNAAFVTCRSSSTGSNCWCRACAWPARRCGPKLERLSWLEPYARVTRRLGESVAQLCRVASIRHVASFFGLDWKTVKDLDFASLQRQLGPVDLDGLEVIGMDEFAIQKGHRYATVIVEPTRKRVLWVGRGRGRADVRPFFDLLGTERCKRLRAAVMDMNAGYELEVKRHCPQAAIVFDLFHVVAKYGREVIDRGARGPRQ